MREILFRGKRIDNGEWVCGHYYTQVFHPDTIEEDWYHFIKPIGSESWGNVRVIPETVGQYTGLTDKNGKKIFEGDYIVCRQAIEGNFIDEVIEMGYVEMKHDAFGLHRKQGYYRPFKDWLEDYEYEVLGNIHDNPDMLKGGGEE